MAAALLSAIPTGGGPGSTALQYATMEGSAGSGTMGMLGSILNYFGKDPESRAKNLKSLAKILGGAATVVQGATKDGFEDQLAQVLTRASPVSAISIPSNVQQVMAARMLMDLGFGGR